MDKREFRVLLKHCFLMKKSPKEAKLWLDKHYGNESPSKTTVYAWYNEYKHGRLTTEDAQRPGRPSEAVSPKNIRKIHNMIMLDKKLTIKDIAVEMGISKERVGHILKEELQMMKLYLLWVPINISLELKYERISAAETGLDMIKDNPEQFYEQFVSIGETWINHSHKSLLNVFWDKSGVILFDVISQDRITNSYYPELVARFKHTMQLKRPERCQPNILHMENASLQKSLAAMVKLQDERFVDLPHPTNSSDLAPSNYFLLKELKKGLQTHLLSGDKAVRSRINVWLNRKDSDYFLNGIKSIEDRWRKCVDLEGDYLLDNSED